MSYPKQPIRIALARERLTGRLALNAGINPNSGFMASSDDKLNYAEEDQDDRDTRLAYRAQFKDRAVSELAGLIEGAHLTAWRQSGDGSLIMVGAGWAAQCIFEDVADAELVYIDRLEFESCMEVRHPLTEIGEASVAAIAGMEIWHGTGPGLHASDDQRDALSKCKDVGPSADDTIAQAAAIVPPTSPEDGKCDRKPGRPRGSYFSPSDLQAIERISTLVGQGIQIATAARQTERELFADNKTSQWDRLRKAYQRWLKRQDNK